MGSRRRGGGTAPAGVAAGQIRALPPTATTVVQVDQARPLNAECQALISERWSHGLSELAESIGIDSDRLENFLAGHCGISAAALTTLAARMRVSTRFLIGRQQTEKCRILDDDESRRQPRIVPRRAVPPQQSTAPVPSPLPPPVETAEPEPKIEAVMEDLKIEPEPEPEPEPRHPVKRSKAKAAKQLTPEERERRRAYGQRLASEHRQRQLKVARLYGAKI
jgi:type IV secretory pathway VirB10-like protein